MASIMTRIGSEAKGPVKGAAYKIDVISRIGFPVVFTLFSISFWTFYLVWEPDVPDLKMAKSDS